MKYFVVLEKITTFAPAKVDIALFYTDSIHKI